RPPEVGEDAAGAEAEERNRDREEREVVVHDDREDARQRQLDHQERGRHERDAREVAAGRRGHARECTIRTTAAMAASLRRAFVAATLAWAALLAVAPLLASRAHTSASGAAILVAIYA